MRARLAIFATVAALAASGCMNSKPDGKSFTYDCSGAGKGWSDCTEKADTQCGAHNYTIVSQQGDADAKAGGNSAMKRTLVVACK